MINDLITNLAYDIVLIQEVSPWMLGKLMNGVVWMLLAWWGFSLLELQDFHLKKDLQRTFLLSMKLECSCLNKNVFFISLYAM